MVNVDLEAGCLCVQVYYSPAFLRQSIGDALTALRVLAEVYRAARNLFPLQQAESDGPIGTVTVHIDQLKAAGAAKDLCTTGPAEGQVWLLVRTSDHEASVQGLSLFEDAVIMAPSEPHRVLRLGKPLLAPPLLTTPLLGANKDAAKDAACSSSRVVPLSEGEAK